jgi:demethylmenaquinone methyltransferase/2-methoxy-6-polyprenyl-1,4-benzoquinol methylase
MFARKLIGTSFRKEPHFMTPKTTDHIRRIFSEDISATYEIVNHVLTFGFDIIWRKRTAEIASAAGVKQWADVCTGTGEMAVRLSRLAPKGTKIIGVDLSLPMMAQALEKPAARNIHFMVSDVKALAFPDNSLDLLTLSFATRNINLSRDMLVRTFTEFHRVLKPGGCFINLETSQPSCLLMKWLFHLYIRLFVKSIGRWISGSRVAYAYLAYTIPRFYSPEELKDIMCCAGFKHVTFRKWMAGVAAIHRGIKL